MSDTENTLESIDSTLIKKDNEITQMVATEEYLYVLYADKTIEALKADNIAESVAKSDKLDSLGGKGEVTAFTYCEVNNELWIGDNKQSIHIFDAVTLKKKEDVDLATEYGHPVSMMAASNDKGKVVVAGDKNGYVTVFDAETKSKKCYLAYNSKRITNLEFSKDDSLLCTLSIDKMLTIGNLENKGKPLKLSRPNGQKDTNDTCNMVIDGVNHIFTGGHDHSVRMFKF